MSQFFRASCDQVLDRIYLRESELREWHEACLLRSNQIGFNWSLENSIQLFQSQLNVLHMSHLQIWSPAEMKQVWESESKETGLRIRNIEYRFFVYEILPESPASKLDIRVGDEILSINNIQPTDEWEPQTKRGNYRIARGDKTFEVRIIPEVLKIDESPKLVELNNPWRKNAIWLRLPSLMASYFEKEEWQRISKDFQSYDFMVLDLRGNTGGDFVAMLRVLSSFLCEKESIGKLQKTTDQVYAEQTQYLPDNIESEMQIEMVQNHRVVGLRAFAGYACFEGDLRVLVDQKTASTAEILAHSLKQRLGTRVYGEQTAGDVLLAIWYPSLFGKDYSISIPSSIFLDMEGEILEGEGVEVQRLFLYEAQSASQGIDNWLQNSLRF